MDIQFSPSPSSHSPFRDNMDILNMESVAANLFPVNPPAVAGCGQEEGLEALGNVLMRKVQDLVGELVTPNVLNMESIAANLPPVNPPAVAGCSQEGLEALGNDLMIKLQDVAGEHVNILESHTWQNIPESHTPQNILDSLTPYVRKHVEELRQLQVKHYQLVAKFHKERSALEAKYLKHYDPLYTKRYDIVNGGVTNEVAAHAPKENGVPNFWMNAMKNNRLLTQEITEHDEGALRCLKDIKLRRIENFKGFELEFIFDKKKNPFFENDVLTKTYHMVDEGDSILLEATGTNIEWYPGKCLTERSQKKKPNKRSKPFAFNVAYKSFFNFFNPPRAHKDDMQQDFSVGVTIRDKIIPYAVSWFTGEALQDEHEDYDKYLCDGDEGWQASSLESLSPDVWKHVEALKQLQVQHDELQAKFLTERALLEAEYQKFYEPIYSKRYDIVNGVVEVEGVTNEEEADEQGATDAPKEKGVPNFWMNAMKNHKFLAEEIRKQDEEALQYLKDIKCCNVENSKGFELQFFFGTNLFFKNDVLTKTYNIIGLEETILEKAIGTEIEWYPGKCLTHKRSTKSKKRSKYAKPFTFSETCESFFNFFNPEMFDDDDDEEREHDYKVGCTVQTEIIPYAVSWFTGEAVEDDDGR